MTPDHLANLIAQAVGPAVEQAARRAFAAQKGAEPPARRTHLRLVPGGQPTRKPKRPAPGGAA